MDAGQGFGCGLRSLADGIHIRLKQGHMSGEEGKCRASKLGRGIVLVPGKGSMEVLSHLRDPSP